MSTPVKITDLAALATADAADVVPVVDATDTTTKKLTLTVLTTYLTSALTGLVSAGSQTWAGVKTFSAAAIFSLGIQLGLLFNTNGTGSTDVCVKTGTSQPDGSTHSTARIFSVRTGLNGGSEVEYLTVNKSGLYLNGYTGATISCSGSWLDLGALPIRSVNYFVSTLSSTAFYASGNGFFSAPSMAKFGSENQLGAAEVAVRVGHLQGDGSVNSAAVCFQVATGMNATPVPKLEVIKDGTVELKVTGAGIVMQSPDGTRYRLTVANGGTLTIAAA